VPFTLLLDTTRARVLHRCMKSQLAEAARHNLTEDVKRMTAEQRRAAFLAHCQLMVQLNSAGGAIQHRPRHAVPRNAG
jgi:hypothetical protein